MIQVTSSAGPRVLQRAHHRQHVADVAQRRQAQHAEASGRIGEQSGGIAVGAVGSGSPMVNNPSRGPSEEASNGVSAGPEIVAPTAGGAMLYDASRMRPAGRADLRSRPLARARCASRRPPAAAARSPSCTTASAAGCCVTTAAAGSWRACSTTPTSAPARRARGPSASSGCCANCASGTCRCPVPVAARYVRSGALYRADLLTEELPDAAHAGPGARSRTAGRGDLARRRRLHRAGCTRAACTTPTSTRTTSCSATTATVYVLDFDRGRVRARGAWEQARARAPAPLARQGDARPAGGPLRRRRVAANCCAGSRGHA